jgi:hypothetical protein
MLACRSLCCQCVCFVCAPILTFGMDRMQVVQDSPVTGSCEHDMNHVTNL